MVKYATLLLGLAILLATIPAFARPGEDWKCGRLPVFVYADKYGDENGENRPDPPFKMAFDHGKTGKRLPSHLFQWRQSGLYYRGKRCV